MPLKPLSAITIALATLVVTTTMFGSVSFARPMSPAEIQRFKSSSPTFRVPETKQADQWTVTMLPSSDGKEQSYDIRFEYDGTTQASNVAIVDIGGGGGFFPTAKPHHSFTVNHYVVREHTNYIEYIISWDEGGKSHDTRVTFTRRLPMR